MPEFLLTCFIHAFCLYCRHRSLRISKLCMLCLDESLIVAPAKSVYYFELMNWIWYALFCLGIWTLPHLYHHLVRPLNNNLTIQSQKKCTITHSNYLSIYMGIYLHNWLTSADTLISQHYFGVYYFSLENYHKR